MRVGLPNPCGGITAKDAIVQGARHLHEIMQLGADLEERIFPANDTPGSAPHRRGVRKTVVLHVIPANCTEGGEPSARLRALLRGLQQLGLNSLAYMLYQARKVGGVWADLLDYVAGEPGKFHFDGQGLMSGSTAAWVRVAINLLGGRGMDFTDGINVFNFPRQPLDAMLLLPSSLASTHALLPHRGAVGDGAGLQLILTFVKLPGETLEQLMERVRAICLTIEHAGHRVHEVTTSPRTTSSTTMAEGDGSGL